jgi:hypothetical protein
MNTEEQLVQLKKEYLATPTPMYLQTDGWHNVRLQLHRQPQTNWWMVFQRGFIAICLCLFFMGGFFGVAQASQPGDVLYPVKIFTDNTIAQITQSPEIPVEKRVEDIVQTAQDDPGKVQEAATQYSKSLDRAQKNSDQSKDNRDLKQSLEKQQQKLKQVIQKHPELESKLQPVIQKTQEVQSQVKGTSPEHGNNDAQDDKNNNSKKSEDTENNSSHPNNSGK